MGTNLSLRSQSGYTRPGACSVHTSPLPLRTWRHCWYIYIRAQRFRAGWGYVYTERESGYLLSRLVVISSMVVVHPPYFCVHVSKVAINTFQKNESNTQTGKPCRSSSSRTLYYLILVLHFDFLSATSAPQSVRLFSIDTIIGLAT